VEYLKEVSFYLTRKHYTILERLARSKHSSLSGEFIPYGGKNMITLAPGLKVIKIVSIIYEFSL
jgi:hypothetical protein